MNLNIFNLFDRFGTSYSGHLKEANARFNNRPNARFWVSGSEPWNRFTLSPGNIAIDLPSLPLNYSFSRSLTLSSLVQMDTANTQAMSANIRLRDNYRPDSDLYVIDNVPTRFASLATANPLQLREQRFAVKFTYSFTPFLERVRSTEHRQKEEP